MSGDAEPDELPSTMPLDRNVRTADYDGRNANALLAGRYRLLEPVGEGGMGTVWKAEQTEPVRRLVAVKLIKAGADSEAVLARFGAERQALAMMDHPNIAKVLDADMTGDGRPFFVMELVRGEPITRYVVRKNLSPRERLTLFIPVCQAIQHAHQKGIIHRDIKPSNVLVAEYDGKPVPKVIDFGVAKAAGGKLAGSTVETNFGALVGTPEYMSPEQAADSADIDTRSDVYALGVLLYELLTGAPPHDRAKLKSAGLIEILRVVREEEPPPPSSKLTGIRVPNVQELDWIVLKALEKDRARRYDSANALAADVERHLANETVSAGPPGAGYRLRKFARRHRAAVLGSTVVLLALLAGLMGAIWGMLEARRERDAADTARAQAMADQQIAEAARAEEAIQRDRANTARKIAENERTAAIKEREEKERAAIRAEGLRLAAESTAALAADPGLALRLAIDGARRHPHHLTFAALDNAADALHETRTLTGVQEPLAVRPDRKGFACATVSTLLPERTKNTAVTLFDANGNAGVGWPGYGLDVGALAISPDGTRVATALVGAMLAEIDAGTTKEKVLYTGNVAYVWDAATGKDLLHLRGHTDRIVHIEFSPDNQRILTASHDGTARLWNAATGEPIGPPLASECSLSFARFSPDGTRILTVQAGRVEYDEGPKMIAKQSVYKIDPGITDRPIRLLRKASSSTGSASASDLFAARVWEAATGRQIAGLRRARTLNKITHNWTITQGRFSPDGSKVLLAFTDDVAGEWDATRNGTELYLLKGTVGEVTDACYAANGKTILTVGQDGRLHEFQAGTGQSTSVLDTGVGAKSNLRMAKDERRRLVVGDANLTVWPGVENLPSGGYSIFTGHRGRIVGAEFLDDNTIVSVGRDFTARLWSLAKPAVVARVIPVGAGSVASFDVSPDRSRLAVVVQGDGATVRILDVATGRQICEIGRQAVLGAIRSVRFNSDGTQVVTASDVTNGSRDGKVVNTSAVHVWDAKTGEEYYSFPTHEYGARYAAFFPDGRRIVSVSDGNKRWLGGSFSGSRSNSEFDGIVRIWDATTRKLLYQLTQKVLTNATPSIGPDGRIIGLANYAGAMAFHALDGRELWRATEPHPENAIAFSLLPSRVATWGFPSMHLRDSATGKPLVRLLTDPPTGRPEFSTDGTIFAVPVGSSVTLVDCETGTAGVSLVGHEKAVLGISFAPDGRSCLTHALDGTAAVWTLPDGKLKTVYRSSEGVLFAAFVNGGVATAGRDGVVRLWPEDPVAELQRRAPRELTDPERVRYGP